jgi:hypothetical protein
MTCREKLAQEHPEETPHILDSGNRRQFESGAVRDMAEGKGRCDLLPLGTVYSWLKYLNHLSEDLIVVFNDINKYLEYGSIEHLCDALNNACIFDDPYTMLLEVAKHFEEGCKKYGENNWRKGMPVKFFIDSAIRHYLKYLRGDKDEPHDRAFCWNILCAIWTHEHIPELRSTPLNSPYSEQNKEGNL